MNRSRKKALKKSTWRDIKDSFGRYFAILAITLLGVGFFSGVRITTPVMVHTVNDLYDRCNLYDYRLVSTLGWEDEDVEEIRSKKDVAYAEGSFMYDVICLDSEEKDNVFKAYSITENVNKLMVAEGRLPEKDNEVVLDSHNRCGTKLGDMFRLSGTNDKDTRDHFKYSEYKIVGYVDSSLYINFERGNTSLGNGMVTGFMYLTKGGFDEEIYTEIYVKLDGDYEIYSDEYKDRMDMVRSDWEDITDETAMARYDRIYKDASEEIADAKKTLADKKADGEKELKDAKKELDDAKEKLADGEKELADAANEIKSGDRKLGDAASELGSAKTRLDDAEKTLAESKPTLDESGEKLKKGKKQLDDSKLQLDKAKAELDSAKTEIDKNEKLLKATDKQLRAAKKTLDTSRATLDKTKKELEGAEEEISKNEIQLNQAEESLNGLKAAGMIDDKTFEAEMAKVTAGRKGLDAAKTKYNEGLKKYQIGEKQYSAGLAEYNSGYEQYSSGAKTLAEGKVKYENGLAQYKKGLAEYEKGLKEYNAGYSQYEEGLKQYENGVKEVNSGKESYAEGLREYSKGVNDLNKGKAEYADGLKEYEDGRAEYEDGLAEYEDGVDEFNEKIADAEKELADAEKELEDLDKPDTYVLERNTNIAYSCFESDSEIVAQVARVFPVFFILVAALVCMTTMTRMVEEQRSQIGTLKALGYSSGDIVRKFIVYAGSASLIGCVIGYAFCIILFPFVIWNCYRMMYIKIPILYIIDWKLALISVVVSLACSVGTTLISCRYELLDTAANLMRPKAPKPGKRVFLEYIPALWNRMKFLHKVSIRNILRYKRRFFMMIIGISGCTALVLTGFGMKDSVAGFAEAQYGDIQVADAELTFKNGTESTVPQEILDKLNEESEEYTFIRSASWDLVTGNHVKGINLISPVGDLSENEKNDGADEKTVNEKTADEKNADKKNSGTDDFSRFFKLNDTKGNKLDLPSSGNALVSISLAERYNLKKGDSIILRDEDMNEINATVSGIFQNHVYNYVIVSPDDLKTDINGAYINYPEGTDVYDSQSRLSECDDTVNVSIFNDFKNRMTKMMSSLNYVVLIVILSAAGLAFIVLYNLTNINITERIREIATIKVLGFYPNETAQYVFRENVFLTFIGMLAGLGLGILLHRFVMAQIVVDMVYFKVHIDKLSFLYAVLLTFMFTFLVNLVMRGKLSNINMAESLKSVE